MIGEEGAVEERYRPPAGYSLGSYMHTQMDYNGMHDGIRYVGFWRPNAMWRAANSRPRGGSRTLGWSAEPRCLFNALDLPTSQKRIIANYYEQRVYRWASQYPEFRRLVDPVRYRFTTPPFGNIFQAASDTTYQESLCPSWRMLRSELYDSLERLGIEEGGSPLYKDYCLLRSAGQLDGSMTANAFMPPLQQDAIRAAMGAIWMGSSLSALRTQNSFNKRLVKFTLYRHRHTRPRAGYFAYQPAVEPVQQNIVFVDKLQRIYPEGSTDGEPGAGNYLERWGERGSHCFRPENIPNWEAADDKTKNEWPLGLVLDTERHYGETRWAVWNKRILCGCETRGWFAGCLNLNDGDHDTERFAGRHRYPRTHPIIANAMPLLDRLAVRTSIPGHAPPSGNGLDLETVTLDTGRPGPLVGAIRPNLTQLLPPDLPLDFLICSTIQGSLPGTGQGSGQSQTGTGQQGGQNPGNAPNGTPGGSPGATPGSLPEINNFGLPPKT
jgi:hypothetical protein